jgi:hypothetical protein
MEAGRERDGPERTVGSECDLARFRCRGDPAQLGNSAGMCDIRLHHRNRTLRDEILELPSSVEPFSGCERHVGRGGKLAQCVGIVTQHRLFEEQRMVAFEQLRNLATDGGVQRPWRSTAMSISSPSRSRSAWKAGGGRGELCA